MTRPGPISTDPVSDQWPAAVWPGGRPTAVPVRRQPIGPKPIVVVDRGPVRGPVVTDAERDAVGRLRAAWLGKGNQ